MASDSKSKSSPCSSSAWNGTEKSSDLGLPVILTVNVNNGEAVVSSQQMICGPPPPSL